MDRKLYEECLKNGCSEKLAEMLASHEGPHLSTDTALMINADSQFTGTELQRKQGEYLARQCEKHGGSPNGKRYSGQLAKFPGDPDGWYSSKADIKRTLKKTGAGCDGLVNVKRAEEIPKIDDTMPKFMDSIPEGRVMLAADVFDRVMDYIGADGTGDKGVRDSRRAIQDALREFPMKHRWVYHQTWRRMMLDAPYSTGTVQFDSTTNTLILTGGTWPTWAAAGFVLIGQRTVVVSARTSGTVLTLDPYITFPADLAAGTGYTIFREQYDLPTDFLSSDSFVAENPFGPMQYVYQQDWLERTRSSNTFSGQPAIYTVAPSATTVGRYALRIWPPAGSQITLDNFYQRRPRAVKYYKEASGKITAAASSTTITGDGTAFRSDMVGSYIRISRDTVEPTSAEGTNVAAQEFKITAVASTTSLTIDSAATETAANVAYVISDPIDIEAETMGTYFGWLCLAQAAPSLRMEDAAMAIKQEALTLGRAKEADARNSSRSVAGQKSYRSQWWRQPLGPDRG